MLRLDSYRDPQKKWRLPKSGPDPDRPCPTVIDFICAPRLDLRSIAQVNLKIANPLILFEEALDVGNRELRHTPLPVREIILGRCHMYGLVAPLVLSPDELLEGVLEDLWGFALEQQALVAADLLAQVHQLVAQRGRLLE